MIRRWPTGRFGCTQQKRRPTWTLKRLKRTPPMAWMFEILSLLAPAKKRAEFARFSGIVRVGRRA